MRNEDHRYEVAKETGRRLREWRKGAHLNQEEAAELFDLTGSFYGNIERGHRLMSIETLMKISDATGLSTDYILYGRKSYSVSAMEITDEEIKKIIDLLNNLRLLI